MSIRLPSAVNNKKKRDEGSNRWSSICGSSPHWNCPVCTLKLWPETVWNKNHQAKYLMLNLLQSCLNQNDQKMAWKFHHQWDRTDTRSKSMIFLSFDFHRIAKSMQWEKESSPLHKWGWKSWRLTGRKTNWFVFPSPYRKKSSQNILKC